MKPHDFAELMLGELTVNAEQKGPWPRWRPSPPEWEREMAHHVEKLRIAIRDGNPRAVCEHAADVGNIAMKAVEVFGPRPQIEYVERLNTRDVVTFLIGCRDQVSSTVSIAEHFHVGMSTALKALGQLRKVGRVDEFHPGLWHLE
jgi:hypothetical protein